MILQRASDLNESCILTDEQHLDNVVEWLERHSCDRHGVGSKPTGVILLFPWKRHLIVLSPALLQAVPNFSHIFIKLKLKIKILTGQQFILVSPETCWSKCLPFVYSTTVTFLQVRKINTETKQLK